MAICPFAVAKLIPPGDNDPRINARVVIWHVAVSMTASLFSYFRDRSGGIESHFYITWLGKLEQYRDTDWEADANYLANPFAISIETAGWGTGRWNLLQRRMMKRVSLWLNEAHDIPLQRCPAWDGAGHGYHTMYGAPGKWTNVAKACPGADRIIQFEEWFVPWLRTASKVATSYLPSIRERLRRKRRAAKSLARKAWLASIIRLIRRGPKETP